MFLFCIFIFHLLRTNSGVEDGTIIDKRKLFGKNVLEFHKYYKDQVLYFWLPIIG
jgi:hypothetical protein